MSTIPKTKAWEFEFRLTHRLEETGKEVPFKDATVRAWLSNTLGGSAITEANILTLTEREERPGVYFGVLTVDQVAVDLTGKDEGDIVYEVCERNGEIDSRPLEVTLVSVITIR